MQQQAQQAQQAQVQQQMQQEFVRQQQQNAGRRTSLVMEPASAGPTATSFGRRASQAEFLKSQLNLNRNSIVEEEQPQSMPMTGALNGRFGGRLNPNAAAFRLGGISDEEEQDPFLKTGHGAPANTPVTPNYTSVVSGNASLGKTSSPTAPPSRCDGITNWRRAGNNNSVLNGNNRSASLSVKITPPPADRVSPPSSAHPAKSRPEPLRFSVQINDQSSGVLIDNSDGEQSEGVDDASSSSDSLKSESVPTTPPSGGLVAGVPLSPREEASKRLYEGLGMGRPIPQSANVHSMSFPGIKASDSATNVPHTSVAPSFGNRVTSQPSRQPRGPPCGVDELGPKNFATRIRRKAIGGLGALLDARANRREVEAC